MSNANNAQNVENVLVSPSMSTSSANANDDVEDQSQSAKRKRASYTLEFKRNVILYYKSHGGNASEAARVFNVDRRLVGDWLLIQDEIENASHRRSTYVVSHKEQTGEYPRMEKSLYAWLCKLRDENKLVSGGMIRTQALAKFKELYGIDPAANDAFCASDGWLRGFLWRFKLAYRRVTTTGRELPVYTPSLIGKFFVDCNKLFNHTGGSRNRDKIWNMDETSIYLDCPTKYTYTKLGAKRVKINTPPDNIRVIYKTGATFNEEVVCQYLDMMFHDKPNNVLLVDSARCHLTASVSNKANELNLKRIFIPPRMTNLLQPADVCWFAEIKKAYCDRWSKWTVDGIQTLTIHNNTRSPGFALAIKWLSEIWYEYPAYKITNSFDYCGITTQNALHSTLKHIVDTSRSVNMYVDIFTDIDGIAGFTNHEGEEFEDFVQDENLDDDIQNIEEDTRDTESISSAQVRIGSQAETAILDTQAASASSAQVRIGSQAETAILDTQTASASSSNSINDRGPHTTEQTSSNLPLSSTSLIASSSNSTQPTDMPPWVSQLMSHISRIAPNTEESIRAPLASITNTLSREERSDIIQQVSAVLNSTKPKPTKPAKHPNTSTNLVDGQEKSKKGRKAYPRDENGQIIRPPKPI